MYVERYWQRQCTGNNMNGTVIGKYMTGNQNDLKQHIFYNETEWGILEILCTDISQDDAKMT